MTAPIGVLLLDSLPESRQLTATMLSFDPDIAVIGQATQSADLFPLLEAEQADIVVISDTMQGEEIPKAVWQITRRARHVGVIVISAHAEPEVMRRAMLAGARGFVARPLDSRQLRTTIRDVYARIIEERVERSRQMTVPTGPLVWRRSGSLGHIVAVFGAKGGIGKTTIAVNLAVSLRQETGRDVALVDADLSLGDVGLFLDLTPIHTILDIVEVLEREPDAELDGEFVKGIMERYDPLGLRVLLGPVRPEHAELVTSEHFGRILEVLPRLFDYIVVDCPAVYDERVLSILDRTDQILLIVAPEVGPLKNARHFLDLSETLGYPRECIQIVLNRADSQVSITADDVQRWLAYPVSHRIVSGGPAVAEAV
ncbi:MAG TPA: hypothetical protein DEP84_24325, partial [Chloroflexi bacterium]|nr:hypothetical protein [Chloroflexota bacterium]